MTREFGPASTRRLGPSMLVALCALSVFGAVIRGTGFTQHDLWFDDAWAASAARVPLSKAMHMLATTPGYGLFQRAFIRLEPTTTWWAQIPAFVLGVAAIPALFCAVRYLTKRDGFAFATAIFVAVSPTIVTYSTRVKEYSFDLLIACGMLVLYEVWRRSAKRSSLWPLALLGSFGLLMSAATIEVTAVVFVIVVAFAMRREMPWRQVMGPAATVLGSFLVLYVAFLRHLPGQLNVNWRRRGYLMDWRSWSGVKHSLIRMFGGFAHTTLGYPVPRRFFQAPAIRSEYPPTIVGMAIVGAVVIAPLVVAWRRRELGVGAVSALVLASAVFLALIDRLPFGDGRTDEVLIPAFVLASLATAHAVGSAIGRRLPSWRRPLAIALAGVFVVVGIGFGALHTSKYPEIDLRGISAQLEPRLQPGDVVVVDVFNSFSWCYYRLTTCDFELNPKPVWPQGFRPRSIGPVTLLPAEYNGPFVDIAPFVQHAKRVWYVGYTYGTFDVGSPWLADVPAHTGVRATLTTLGWIRPLRHELATRLQTTNSYAVVLYDYAGLLKR